MDVAREFNPYFRGKFSEPVEVDINLDALRLFNPDISPDEMRPGPIADAGVDIEVVRTFHSSFLNVDDFYHYPTVSSSGGENTASIVVALGLCPKPCTLFESAYCEDCRLSETGDCYACRKDKSGKPCIVQYECRSKNKDEDPVDQPQDEGLTL